MLKLEAGIHIKKEIIMRFILGVGSFVLLSLAMGGCTPDISPDNYKTTATQQVSQVQKGVVINVSQVQVSGANSEGGNWAGIVAGGAAGGIAGSMIGQGSASALAAVGGALIGGIVGDKAEDKLTSQKATQYIIQLSNGTTVSVTQGGSLIPVGTHVLVMEGKPARVLVDTTAAAAS
jgi:outer membrane lipoprotein SlyB